MKLVLVVSRSIHPLRLYSGRKKGAAQIKLEHHTKTRIKTMNSERVEQANCLKDYTALI